MSRDEILREITSEEELAAHEGGWGGPYGGGFGGAYYEGTQYLQCSGILDCGGCDPNGPYGSSGGSSGGSYHC